MISGYYGFGNIGDEAILTSIVDSLRSANPNIIFVVLSSDPSFTSRQLNVKSINRLNLAMIIKELITTDLFISGGGGLMQDVTGLASVSYYSGLIKLAQMLNVNTMIYAQGLGPLNKPFNINIVKKVFAKVDAIAVRDYFSQDDLLKMGLNKNKIQVTADPALLLESVDKKSINNILMAEGIDPSIPIIGIAIRPWNSWYERQLKSFTSVVYQLAKKYNLQILLIPFQQSSDLWISREAEVCFKARPESDVQINVLQRACTPKEMMGLIGAMHIVIGMRLHSLIMAATNNVPSVGIAYDPKVKHFCTLAGFPYINSVVDLQNVENTLSVIESVIANIDDNREILRKNIPHLTELSHNNVKTALSFLK